MLLKLGSKGEDVKSLQEKLGLKADGSFGPGTEKAVKEWQTKNGLVADGVIGDKSWSKLFPEVNEVVLDPSSALAFVQKVKGHIPEKVFQQIPATCAAFNIITPLRLAHFLAQCALESGNFKYTKELGDDSYFQKYEGRKALGNTQPGDGLKFKGRGYIQLTGRANYDKFSKFVNEDCVVNPDLVSTKYPMLSAAYFFNSNKLWTICDQGSTDVIVEKVTRRVNGGINGLKERQEYFRKFWNLLK
jgi:putative chitinase